MTAPSRDETSPRTGPRAPTTAHPPHPVHGGSGDPRRTGDVLLVRPERDDDHAAVRRVQLAAFGDRGALVVRLTDELRESIADDHGLSLVAEHAGEVVGHVLFSPSLLDAPRRLVPVQVLSPLSVLPTRQRTGVGGQLVRHGLELLAERGVPVVFLEGSPDYYSRFGFGAAAPQGFRTPSLRIPDEGFQAVRLAAWESWMTGTLVYAETWWRHDAVGLRDPGA